MIHVLLAQTEQRSVATLDRYVDELVAMRGELAAVLAMLDRSEFTYLCYTPEVPPEARDRAYASGQLRFATWRGAVARPLEGVWSAGALAPRGAGTSRRSGAQWLLSRGRIRQSRGQPTTAAGWGLTGKEEGRGASMATSPPRPALSPLVEDPARAPARDLGGSHRSRAPAQAEPREH